MQSRAPLYLCSLLVCASACKLFDPYDAPSIPDDFPQIGEYEDGRAELVVDGEMVTTKDDGGTFYDPGGLDPATLPASVGFDYTLELRFLAPDEGTYEASDGELTATWNAFELDGGCGDGTMVIVGRKSFDDLLGRYAIWGTLQLELCEHDYQGPQSGRMEISGRFSSLVLED